MLGGMVLRGCAGRLWGTFAVSESVRCRLLWRERTRDPAEAVYGSGQDHPEQCTGALSRAVHRCACHRASPLLLVRTLASAAR